MSRARRRKKRQKKAMQWLIDNVYPAIKQGVERHSDQEDRFARRIFDDVAYRKWKGNEPLENGGEK